ncbi:MAG: hypothetical protein HOP37_00350, partial [Cyclobacteriaceae bacterium]|nr:hypothetical protein [Cyclobacteriaceae bacterium]
MKYLILVSIVVSSRAYSQKSFFGIDAGINLSNQRTSARSNGKVNQVAFELTAARLTVGIFYQQSISKMLSVRLGANYNGLGFRDEDIKSYGPIYGFSSTDIDYVTFPVNLIYQANPHFRVTIG